MNGGENMSYGAIDAHGNAYETLKEMCMEYGVSSSLYCHRIERGWSQEAALSPPKKREKKKTKPKQKKLKVSDHLGNKYDSEFAMAIAYNIPPAVYRSRKRYGWSLEDCLTTPVTKRKRR